MTVHTSDSASDVTTGLPITGLLCYYANSSPQTQIIHVIQANQAQAELSRAMPRVERVVFPGERLLFQALAGATLEVRSQASTGELVVERLLCDRLVCHETASCFPTTLL